METKQSPWIIDQILVGPFAVFSYLITDSSTREAAVIDPGAEPQRILQKISERDAQVRWVVCTHTHPDHIGGTAIVKKALPGAQVAVHITEASRMGKWSQALLVRLFGGKTVCHVDRLLQDDERLPLGGECLHILHTPGHSPGSICLYTSRNLFTGDTLFVGGVGRTDLPGSVPAELKRSIREKILCLPEETRIWPGHDYGNLPSNVLAKESRENPYLVELLRFGGER